MINVTQIFNDFLLLPYFRNYQAVSGSAHNISSHEDAVEDVLIQHGLTAIEFGSLLPEGISTKKELRDALLNNEISVDVTEPVYCSQPTGKNDSPDFIFFVNGDVYFVECKSSKNKFPVYNGGLPKENYIYLFCSEKTNKTTMYLGQDVVSDSVRVKLKEHTDRVVALEADLNNELAAMPENTRGFAYYTRHMYVQKGGKNYVDYFEHDERNECETSVFEHIAK